MVVESVRPVAEERKVVTALFCDLVGFTAVSESADPEDVNRMLDRYAAMARALIEGHGGVVQKFIGDAVVGVFGVPSAHEDDPERAVRVGLRIVEAAEDMVGVGGAPLRVRVGINTGEALVRLGVNPGSGEGFLTGDAINTASRLQGVAPEMGVVVGLATYEATAPVFDYRELEPESVKGKAEPVRVFEAIAARARLGTDLTRTHTSPFIGREIDLALLKGIFEKALASESVQLVTVVGEPGLGKSRLVAELGDYVDAVPQLVTWRQGRCLPYGEGITFWALGEIVKAHAGILESDPPTVATGKLDAVLPEGDERAWFRQRLLPLLGIEASSSAEREELFTAWRRFLEHIAEIHPTVLVFEDLHWADDAMLSFLEHLADRAEGVPLVIVGTARPELYDRRTEYAAGLRNVNTINLSPLSEQETARLVSALLDASVIPAELQRPILDRAGGNPLYAEEFVRLLKDRELLVRVGSSWELREGAQVPFPDSVRALIAARLDTLTPDVKSLLADAAVVGKVFWLGALVAMGDRDPAGVAAALRELSRKELVRSSRRSTIEGEAEFAFWHILTRDVAYAQLPRPSRAARHVAAAAWIASRAPERVEDVADILAYHYSTALDLANATGDTNQAAGLVDPARRFLTLAGERALGLNTDAALADLERALTLTPPTHPDRAGALTRFAEAASHARRAADAREALEDAINAFKERDDRPATAHAMNTLSLVLRHTGDPRWAELPAEALALLEPLPPSAALVEALTEMARVKMVEGRHADTITYAERALALAHELGLDRSARTLGYLGSARAEFGEAEGIDDMRQAITLASALGQGHQVGILHNNLGITLWAFQGPQTALDELRTGVAFARSRGLAAIVDSSTISTLDPLIDTGQLDEALETANTLAPRLERETPTDVIDVRAAQIRIHVLHGNVSQAVEWVDWVEVSARESGGSETLVIGLAAAAIAHAALNHSDHAGALLAELAETPESHGNPYYPSYLPSLVRAAVAVGDPDLAKRLVATFQPRFPLADHALAAAGAILTEAVGDHRRAAQEYADAAHRWERFGVITERGFALLGHGRCLVRVGQSHDAVPILNNAREIFQALGAKNPITETNALLDEATALTS